MRRITQKLLLCIALISGLLLAACKLQAPAGAITPSQAPQAVFTAAAQTAEAMRFATISAVPPTSLPMSSTPIIPSASPTATWTLTPAFTATPTLTKTPAGWNMAEFLEDVTVKDGTQFSPGQAFVKIWRLKNVGTTVWTTAYTLIIATGEQMSGAASSFLPAQASPGETLVLSLNLVAPLQAGHYRGYWSLKAPDGQVFGVGAAYNEPIWVDIVVVNGATPTITPAPTLLHTPTGTITPSP